MREHILSGRLAPGAAVPSSRSLAEALAVARGTVVLAYDQLLVEGYLESRRGTGMFVSLDVPDFSAAPAGPRAQRVARAAGTRIAPARTAFPIEAVGPPIAFAPHRGSIEHLPIDAMRRLQSRLLRASSRWAFDDGPAAGLPALRRAIAAHLAQARALAADPDQIVIVQSTQQGLDLAIRVLTRQDDAVWMEDPGYPGARLLLAASGRRIVDVPVDQEGLSVEAGIALAPGARLAYITPSRQAPMGVALSLPRRAQLMEWARNASSYVFEDDYDSEFRFHTRPMPPMAAAEGDRVILAGSFSKLLFPGLRLAFLVCPPGLVDAFTAMLSLTSRHPNALNQAMLAALIEEGHLARHVRRMRKLYAERAAAFVDVASRHWRGLVEVPAAQAGLDVVGRLISGHGSVAAARLLLAAGVRANPLQAYCAQAKLPPALVMGFAAFRPDEMERAGRKLHQALSAGGARLDT